MFRYRHLLLFFSILVFFSSCSTKLEVNAPYEELKVLYCILDPQQPFQTARISKGFQNEGRSANDIARNNPDSSNFSPIIIKVELIEKKNGLVKREIEMTDTVFNQKDSGLFYYPDQRVYKTANFQIDSLSTYSIKVTNKITGKVSEATTSIVRSYFRFEQPNPYPDIVGDPLFLGFSSKNDTPIKIFKSVNAEVMQAIVYWKIRVFSDNVNYHDEIWTMNAPGDLEIKQSASAPATGFIGKGSFWNYIAYEVAKRGNTNVVARQFLTSEFEVSGASIDYKKYRQAFNNYNSLTQSLPIYTNVSNGLGVMASRNSRRFPVGLDRISKDSLAVRVPQFLIKK